MASIELTHTPRSRADVKLPFGQATAATPYHRDYQEAFSLEQISPHIEKFFNVRREWKTIQDQLHQGVPYEDVHFYNRESMMKFILEFAASIKQTSISYQIKPTGIHFPGVKQPVRTMFENAAAITRVDSRENAELEGWERIEDMIAQGAEKCILISPPSISPDGKIEYGFGKYGFLFYFTKSETGRLKNTVLRYEENELLSTSRLLGYGLNVETEHSAAGYLKSPVDATGLNPKTLEHILGYVGYDRNNHQAERIEKLLLHDRVFSRMFIEYSSLLMSPRPNFLLLKAYVNELYGYAYKLIQKNNIVVGPPPIMQGGSCPISGMGRDYMYIPTYKDAEERFNTKVVTCPGCNYEVLVTPKAGRSKKISCPHCNTSSTCPDGIYNGAKRTATEYQLAQLSQVEAEFVEIFD